MRKILITNNKGGCGKSTLETNLAAYFANEGVTTSFADYDEQGSSVEWLDRRSDKFPKNIRRVDTLYISQYESLKHETLHDFIA